MKRKEAKCVALALGSNMGDREELLKKAIKRLSESVGAVVSVSPFIETSPVGFESVFPFLNAAVCLKTNLPLPALLAVTQYIEKELGRKKKHLPGESYSDRSIDLDILLYDDLVYRDEALQIPHAEMHRRSFVLRPLTFIAPLAVHPILHKTVKELLAELPS